MPDQDDKHVIKATSFPVEVNVHVRGVRVQVIVTLAKKQSEHSPDAEPPEGPDRLPQSP